MRAARRQAKHHITRHDRFAVDQEGLFGRADGETGQVVLAIRVHAGHFGGFPANQCATGELAAARDAIDHARSHIDRQAAAGEIIQEKQRLRPLHENVVDAHGDEIDADSIVSLPVESELELGAHAIRAGDEYRFAVSLGHLKKRPETANSRQDAIAHRASRHRLDAIHEGIARIDIDACVTVGQGCLRLCHGKKPVLWDNVRIRSAVRGNFTTSQ